MVIDSRKAIFIHIPKCGGVSVERSIHKALGGNDNVLYQNLIRKPHKGDIAGLNLHSTLKDFRRYYGKNINDEYYIFSFVRNPWRRMVSHYEYLVEQMINKRLHESNKMSFPDFVQVYSTRMLMYTIHGYKDFLKDDHGTKVNFVGKLENINEDLPKVGVDIKLEITDVLHMNTTDPKVKQHENWKDYYNPGLRDRVFKLYKDDIEKYNYEFDE